MATYPVELYVDELAFPLNRYHDPIDQLPDDGLTVSRCSCRRMPQRRDVGSKSANCLALGVVERGRLFGLEAGILGLQLNFGLQRCLPLALQGARHQAVLRLDGVVLPLCSLSLIAGSLQALLPVPMQSRAFSFHILDGFEADIQGGGLQGG